MSRLPLNLDSPAAPDAAYIRSMFDKMAHRYDTFTALTGFGQVHRWRARALEVVRPGMRVLDLGCGTGDLALAALPRVGPQGEVVGLDFSEQMLRIAAHKHRRVPQAGLGAFRLVQARAEELPLDDRPFDVVVSGFVLRNLYEHLDQILAGVRNSLKPGGQLRLLDLTEPPDAVRRALFRAYFMSTVGLYGALLFGKDYPIPYLPDSARRFHKTDEFPLALAHAGFTGIYARSFMLGTVTLYYAEAPAA